MAEEAFEKPPWEETSFSPEIGGREGGKGTTQVPPPLSLLPLCRIFRGLDMSSRFGHANSAQPNNALAS